ncbi:hypothetical protein VNO78_19307 [Psophocarpus tetragonolobus]|uniref:Uncharacterized protein n=1 Tax=Psophocarpus tetragonolobus TaxID=3891 RepID=A0AAN9S818_PSOTE
MNVDDTVLQLKEKISHNSKQRITFMLDEMESVTDSHFGKMVTDIVVGEGGTVVVNGRCCVEDLRFELDKFHRHALPQNGLYHFTNSKTGNLMTATYAFDWFMMEDGDTIQITPNRH